MSCVEIAYPCYSTLISLTIPQSSAHPLQKPCDLPALPRKGAPAGALPSLHLCRPWLIVSRTASGSSPVDGPHHGRRVRPPSRTSPLRELYLTISPWLASAEASSASACCRPSSTRRRPSRSFSPTSGHRPSLRTSPMPLPRDASRRSPPTSPTRPTSRRCLRAARSRPCTRCTGS